MLNMLKITIDGKEYEMEAGLTIIEVCDKVGIEIPRFCYHPKLAIAGNCRMCLVEVEKFPPKPIPSCNQVIIDGMVIHTNSPMVQNARSGVMEFLLINHPLDCPICDQGGECDLQDQAMRYGRDRGDYNEYKRAVIDKPMGPLIATHMTRCIHCTRCVRFLEDIAGSYELGAIGRGEDMEISTYMKNSITSEISGNIIDLCPVGALTSKPYSFLARSWELNKTLSIDVHDAIGSAIRIDSIKGKVMRILPHTNEEVNECWISDKARFAYDGLMYQRLDTPMIKEGNSFIEASWTEVLARIAKHRPKDGTRIAAISGKMTDVETMMVAKNILQKFGSIRYESRENSFNNYNTNDTSLSNEFYRNEWYRNLKQRELYLFNTTIAKIEKATSCLLVGTNPRYEAAVLNTRIRKAVIHNGMKVSVIGNKDINLNYDYSYLGDDLGILFDICNDNHFYSSFLMKEKNPMIILGDDLFAQSDLQMIQLIEKLKNKVNRVYKVDKEYIENINNEDKGKESNKSANIEDLQDNWNGFNILHKSSSRVGGLDLGFYHYGGIQGALENAEIVLLLEADDFDLSLIPENAFVIYIGHHGDSSVYRADIILPSPAYTEKSGTYINLEGRVQQTEIAVNPIGQAKNSWSILLDIAEKWNIHLSYNTLQDIRNKMIKEIPFFSVLTKDTINSKFNNVYKDENDQDEKLLQESKQKIDNIDRSNLIDSTNFISSTDFINSIEFINQSYMKKLKVDQILNRNNTDINIINDENIFKINNNSDIQNFYLSDSLCRSSKVMSQCVKSRFEMNE